MKFKDVKVGEIIQFGQYRYRIGIQQVFEDREPNPLLWFKADRDGTLVSVYVIENLPYYGDTETIGHHSRFEVLAQFLNSDDPYDDISARCTAYSARTAFRNVRGFLSDFETWEKDIIRGDVSIPSTSNIKGDDRMPLFKKMGIRPRGMWHSYGYQSAWLADPSPRHGQHTILQANGTIADYWGTTYSQGVRPVISIDPNLEVNAITPIHTKYFTAPVAAYTLCIPEVSTPNLYTTKDLCELFGLANY